MNCWKEKHMASNTELFLQEYSKTEELLKRIDSLPDTVLDYEATLDAELSEKLRLCRQIRNYCRHHTDYKKFISVGEGMLQFIQDVNRELESHFMHVSDKTKRIKALTSANTLQEALLSVWKSPLRIAPVVNDEDTVIGVVTGEMMLEWLAADTRKTTKLKNLIGDSVWKKYQKYETIDANTELKSEGYDGVFVVTAKGKYKGLLIL